MASSACSDAIEKCIDPVSECTSAEETYVGVIKLILNGAWARAGRTTVEGATIAVLTVGNNVPATSGKNSPAAARRNSPATAPATAAAAAGKNSPVTTRSITPAIATWEIIPIITVVRVII